ncbi:hypothetical protein Mgra_00000096 [Meloidogyne graminicola]|uniref:MFS domain-containing protein n=1 Tax=Meloidogyne graminicola TaxID=189291 RepID=A0A8T0A4G1_9BILA|nr:hypothetical protein Mgra_00000096 [Meloidogyne graminicola]
MIHLKKMATDKESIDKSNINSTMTISTNSSQNQTKIKTKQSLNNWPTFLCSIIFGIQFLEKLSFYFFKDSLPGHLIDNLGINNLIPNTSQKLFVQITFFAAILGGIFCDLKYGRYKILLLFFIIYLIGQILITISPFIPGQGFLHPYFDFFSIFLIAYGCGCIKAVLLAYGADQFRPFNNNIKQIGYYFALFYSLEQIAIILEIYLFPLIKSFNIWPLSINNKYLLNILFLSIFFLFLSIVILFSTFNYFYQWIPQNNNIFIKSFNIIKQSLINKYRRKPLITTTKQQFKPKYFLEYFLIDHNCQRDKECDFGRRNNCEQAKFISELKIVFEICLVLLPLTLFWAFRTKIISFNILQIQNINPQIPFIGELSFLPIDKLCCLLQPFFILLLIPLFYLFIFKSPSLSQYLFLNTYLRRICLGIFLSFIACFCIANVQKLLNNSITQSTEDFNFVKLFNIFPSKCSFSISRINSQNDYIIISPNDSKIFSLKSEDLVVGYIDLLFRFNGSCSNHRRNLLRISFISLNKINIALIGPQGIFWSSIDGNINYGLLPSIGFLILLPCNSILQLTSQIPSECSNSTNILTQSLTPLSQSLNLCDYLGNCPVNWNSNEVLFSTFFVFPPRGDNMGNGKGSKSIWIAVLSLDGSPLSGQNDSTSLPPSQTFSLLQLSSPPKLGIIWLFPQNILMAASDILVSISGLEFCYVQSPSFLKATLIGYFYLIIYIGFSIVPLISKIQPFIDPFFQLLFYSFSLFNIALIFAIISYFYYNYSNNSFNGEFVDNNQKQLNEEINSRKFTEKISGTLRSSMARLPTKKTA